MPTSGGREVAAGRELAVLGVTLYLALVGLWLICSRQIASPGLYRILRSWLRRPYRGPLQEIRPERGHCFVASAPVRLLSDRESASRVVVFEDGRVLGPGHATHEEIRTKGQGRYSHWGAQVYFSSSDNSDPITNGRVYRIEECTDR